MQNTNVVATYDYYTLDQAIEILQEHGLYTLDTARKIIHDEDSSIARAEARARDNARRERRILEKEERRTILKNRLIGAATAAIGIITAMLTQDITCCILALVVGNYVLITGKIEE